MPKLPEVGATYKRFGSDVPYVCVRREWYQRKDGKSVEVPVWTAACRQCQVQFEQRNWHPDTQRCRTCIGPFQMPGRPPSYRPGMQPKAPDVIDFSHKTSEKLANSYWKNGTSQLKPPSSGYITD